MTTRLILIHNNNFILYDFMPFFLSLNIITKFWCLNSWSRSEHVQSGMYKYLPHSTLLLDCPDLFNVGATAAACRRCHTHARTRTYTQHYTAHVHAFAMNFVRSPNGTVSSWRFCVLSAIGYFSANRVAAIKVHLFLQWSNFNYELCSLKEFVREADCAFHFTEDMLCFLSG
jgi:hypothetical protein